MVRDGIPRLVPGQLGELPGPRGRGELSSLAQRSCQGDENLRKYCRGLWQGRCDSVIMPKTQAMVVQGALADVLVTKSGSRYKGTVVDKGDSYLLIKPSGGRITLAKSMVREVIKDPAGGKPTDPPAPKPGTKVRDALQPLRTKVLVSRQALGKAIAETRARHKQELADAVSAEDQKAIRDAEEHLELIRDLASGLGKRGPGPPTPGIRNEVAIAASVEIKMPDGTTKMIMITPRNKASQVSKAQSMVFAARRLARAKAAKKVSTRHRKELSELQALYAGLTKADARLRAAAAAIAPVQNDPEKLEAEVKKCAKQLDESLAAVAKDLDEISSRHAAGDTGGTTSEPRPPSGSDERSKLIAAMVAKGDRMAKRDAAAAEALYHLASVYAPRDEAIAAKKRAIEAKVSGKISTAEQRHFFRLAEHLHPDHFADWPAPTQAMDLVEMKLLSDQALVGSCRWGWIRMEKQGGLKARCFSFSPTGHVKRVLAKYGQPSSQKNRGSRIVLTYGRIRLIASGSGRIVGVLYNDPNGSE